MEDLGPPTSWLTLEPGRPVYSCDGEKLGKVDRVIGDTREDIFEGVAITRGILPGEVRFVDAEQIEEIFERGVLLKLDATAAEQLPDAD